MKATAAKFPSVEMVRARVTELIQEDGRVVGVRYEEVGVAKEARAPLVVGCDGGESLVRRSLGIPVERHPYDHELMYIAAEMETDPPQCMHFNLDDQGVIMVVNRPGGKVRIAIGLATGARGDLLRRPDPALYEYIVGRVPWLAPARFTRENAYVYPLVRRRAERFFGPGAALVGDSAHVTHPTGATGMNLAISGAARLAEMTAPVLQASGSAADMDAALAAYDAERRPAAHAAVLQNHEQALKIWEPGVQDDPDAYARNANPAAAWGVGGAGWGQNPAALAGAR